MERFAWGKLRDVVLPEGQTFQYRLDGFKAAPVKHYEQPLWLKVKSDYNSKGNICTFKFQLRNLKQYFKAFKNKNKFALVINNLIHDDPSFLGHADEVLMDLYTQFEESGYLENTVFILLGDHGFRSGSFRATVQGKLEERKPFLSITVPSWFEKYDKYMKYMRLNRDVLTTHYDTHSTLMHILTFPEVNEKADNSNGVSYLSTDLRLLNRSCEDVGIAPHWCLCLRDHSPVQTNDSAAYSTMNKVLDYMNTKNKAEAEGSSIMGGRDGKAPFPFNGVSRLARSGPLSGRPIP